MKKQRSPHKNKTMPETTTVVPAICFELTEDIFKTLPSAVQDAFHDLVGQTVALVGARPIDR